MQKLVLKNPILRFKIQYYLGGTPKGGINLGIKSKEEIESNNNRERNLASHHFSKVFSDNEGIWDGIKHLARGILHGYNGYLDPETLYQTGAPTILPGRTPTKVPSIKKVGTMLKNKLFLRGYNKSGVRISSVPVRLVPEGERITFFKNADGSRTPRYYDKKYGHWIDVEMQTPKTTSNVAKVVKAEPYSDPDVSVSIMKDYNAPEYNIPLYNYDDDVMMINSAAALDDAIYNYDPGIIDIFKIGGRLISKNPVLRFKLGRKILFALKGTSFPVTVDGTTFLYNPYTKTYTGGQKPGQRITGELITNAFNKLYESVKHNGSSVYRKKGSHTTWTNSEGKQVNLIPSNKTQTNNSSFKTSENGRFRVLDRTSGKELRFDSRDEAKKYQMSAKQQGTRVLYDDEKESRGQVVRIDRTKEKATEYGRKKLESNNNLTFKQAYLEGRKSGNKYFAYNGKVYKTDLTNGKDNMTEMMQLYGDNLGYSKHPNINTKQSADARRQYRKDIDAKQGNRNANYKGKTNKLASAEADKKVAQTWDEAKFVDALMPVQTLNLPLMAMDKDYKPEIYRSGLNLLGYALDAVEGNLGGLATRALDTYATFGAPGMEYLVTKMAPRIPIPTYLLKLYHGDAGSTNWVINSLNRASGKTKNFLTRLVPRKGNGLFGKYSVQAAEHISPEVTAVVNNGARLYVTGNPEAVQPLYTYFGDAATNPKTWLSADITNLYANNNYE